MQANLKIKSPWAQLGLFAALIVGFLVFTSLVVAVIYALNGVKLTDVSKIDFSAPGMADFMKLLQAVSSVTIFFLPAFVFAFLVARKHQMQFLGFQKAQKLNFYLLAILIIFFSLPFVGWLGQLNEHIPLTDKMNQLEKEAGKQLDAFLNVRSTGAIINVPCNFSLIRANSAFTSSMYSNFSSNNWTCWRARWHTFFFSMQS